MRTFLLSLLACLSLAACGGKSNPPADPGAGAGAGTGTEEPATAGCETAGCSDVECVEAGAAADMVTTCEYLDVYGCYEGATCERQADGQCGWTQTDELAACLEAGGPAATGG
jgi:hypothetical protein